MFLTTVRVRRLRAKTLNSLPSHRAGNKTAIASGLVVEVTAHAQLIAVVDASLAVDGPSDPKRAIVWMHPDVAKEHPDYESALVEMVGTSCGVMGAVDRAGLTATAATAAA